MLPRFVAAPCVGRARRRALPALLRLQDTTAEIRVRGAFLLLALFVVLASRFGLEAILGAFLAGATLKLVDRDEGMTHAFFHRKLEAVGFGVERQPVGRANARQQTGQLRITINHTPSKTRARCKTKVDCEKK